MSSSGAPNASAASSSAAPQKATSARPSMGSSWRHALSASASATAIRAQSMPISPRVRDSATGASETTIRMLPHPSWTGSPNTSSSLPAGSPATAIAGTPHIQNSPPPDWPTWRTSSRCGMSPSTERSGSRPRISESIVIGDWSADQSRR